ncbi:hypothetical protein GCM10011575_05110 [Microlunatus endophyticus]|uniref:Uncharacterized protein n=1 Tax=Microlunatus endophyticus TaxID=1716077 RepID=A0A917W162_9ACTN|nr:hypothetical protein [Microlunatus endophyticus]GGL49896.1 hypothetical protein GCM10011575_05110 [Microlunatus endophyticus]
MIWVYVFGGIAVAGLIMLVAYAVWLAHKASDVFAELRVLGQRTARLADLAAQIQVPELGTGPERFRDPDKNAISSDREAEYHDVG